MNLVNDLAHHESPLAQCLEHSTGVPEVVGLICVGYLEFCLYFLLVTDSIQLLTIRFHFCLSSLSCLVCIRNRSFFFLSSLSF